MERRLCILWLLIICLLPVDAAAAPAFSAGDLELRIHQLVNAERQAQRLPALTFDQKLAKIARGHSQDMAEGDYFSHIDRAGHTPGERANAAGFACRVRRGQLIDIGVAENLSLNHRYSSMSIVVHDGREERSYRWNSLDEIARSTVNGWLSSLGHRENLLDPTLGSEGIGIVFAADGKIYITQLFC
ncbi:hypothetical protein JCM30471_20980 [Desulfuromonas carbonis]|uniref:CAP domain-containing protein n=1 Tax=Desulfuromonas sp. DDH964 TaxID=1823759 RepID=UPI00078BD206|nr:CAP domain-containing protein [Desulfuromonas sp. DDH964]AMV73679.1 hypothetical protein DBW_3381 [Desulfuromonas sp. DDH964]